MPTHTDSDEAIVAAAQRGDNGAYGTIISRYEQKLTRYVVYLIHDSTCANDVVQETFIKAYRSLNSFNPTFKFSSWMYRIAHNEAMNAIKKNAHSSGTALDDLPDLGYDPEIGARLDQEFTKRNVQECLASLEPKYREVIQLVYFEHMKYDDVSDVLHVPSSTVGVWLSRAKKKLRTICVQKGVRHE